MNAQPKPVKRATVKRHTRTAKNANIAAVREQVELRDGDQCRLIRLLKRAGFELRGGWGFPNGIVELAHLDDRGMGGNPDLSRDTTTNTMFLARGFHQGRFSKHSGHIKVRPMTELGADGPCCFEFYEKLPTEIR